MRQDARGLKALLREAFAAGVQAVSPARFLPAALPEPAPGRTLVVAIGKAAASMALAAQGRMGPRSETIVVTRYGHGVDGLAPDTTYLEAAHPVPDEAGVAAARLVLERAAALGPDDMLLALVTGGGSSLLTLPPAGVRLEDLQTLNRALLRSGAPIGRINGVRKHVSAFAGGRLALVAAPAHVVTLALSDVPGDDIGLIASGPTLGDPTTLADARATLAEFAITPPPAIAAALGDPASESPFPDDPRLVGGSARVVACARDALAAAGAVCARAGYAPVFLGDDLEGASVALAGEHAALALDWRARGDRHALISGGETSVLVRNPAGRGGRNSEYLLALALGLDGADGIVALAGDTDGIDGTEAAAGAVIDPTSLTRARAAGLDPAAMLQDNLSYPLFEALNDLLVTGPTLTNVNDLRVILIDAGPT
jgi:glycerate 2-kinase